MDNIEKAKKYIKSQITNISNCLQIVTDEVYENRLKTCQSCEHFENNHCKLCGCKLAGESGFTSKLKLPHEMCPIGKWGPVRE